MRDTKEFNELKSRKFIFYGVALYFVHAAISYWLRSIDTRIMCLMCTFAIMQGAFLMRLLTVEKSDSTSPVIMAILPEQIGKFNRYMKKRGIFGWVAFLIYLVALNCDPIWADIIIKLQLSLGALEVVVLGIMACGTCLPENDLN